MELQTIANIIEIVCFSLLVILLIYLLVADMVKSIKVKKAEKNFYSAMDDLIKSAILVEVENKNEKETSKKTTTNKKKSSVNYNDINILELRKIAQKRKLKGYYRLSKKELVKALEETD